MINQRRRSRSDSSSSSDSSVNSQPIAGISSTPWDPVFTRAPPPAYNEALHHVDAKDPPYYPDEEKKVPYPVSPSIDPVYPSAPPVPDGNQGYPPPTNIQPLPTAPGIIIMIAQ